MSGNGHGRRPGRIVLLNGASSAGKSSIVTVLHRILDGYWIHSGVDHWLERLPLRFSALATDASAEPHDGVTWVLPGGSPPLTELRIGPVGHRILGGAYHAYAALASAGNDLIVDDVMFDPHLLREALVALEGHDVLFVGVICPEEVAEERERARGDRIVGLARFQTQLVHAHGVYDLEVDTSMQSADECAERIKARLESGNEPTAFDQLRSAMQNSLPSGS
jgi:chloramphenicol 3-O phosphotransferase